MTFKDAIEFLGISESLIIDLLKSGSIKLETLDVWDLKNKIPQKLSNFEEHENCPICGPIVDGDR